MRTMRMVTSNDGKAREFARALEGLDWELERVFSPYLEVQAETLDEVAWASARYLLEAGSVEPPFFLEDAGLFVDALGGFPGVYSAYVFSTIGAAGVLTLVEGRDERGASFESRVALCLEGGEVELIGGSCRGTIAGSARGEGGFGYDPIFVPEGHDRTFAEMSVEEKGAISHRGRSASALRERLSE
jgi:XTP/dITP diphosphohydrolase